MARFRFYIYIITFFILLINQPNRFESFDSNFIFYSVLLIFFNIIIFFQSSVKVSSWISFETFFLLGFIIVHFQIPFLACFDIEPGKPKLVWINKQVVNYATWLSNISIMAWIIGNSMHSLFKGLFKARETTASLKSKKLFEFNISYLSSFFYLLFILFLALVGKDFLNGNYNGGANWGAGAIYIYLILRVVLYLKIVYFFKLEYTSETSFLSVIQNNFKFLFFVVIYLLLFLNAGDRGPIIEFFIVSSISYTLFINKLKLKYIVIGALFFSFFLTIVKAGRTRDTSDREQNILVQGYQNTSESENVFNPTDELASTVRILYLGLDKVPYNHPYLSGITFLHETISIIPFGMSFYLQYFPIPESYFSTSRFFTILRQGKNYSSGDGSEILADIYVNFGQAGTIILMFLFGFVVSFIKNKAINLNQDTWVIVYIFLVIGALYMNRSSLLDPLKTIFYALFLNRFLIRRIYAK